MLILALDTSSAGGSTALLRDGGVAGVRSGDPSRTHGEQLPAESRCRARQQGVAIQDVDLFAVAIGPGSFTGLRVGIAAIRGWRSRTARWSVPVSTFDALAWQHRAGAQPAAAWIDARRGEVFAALYSPGRLCTSPPHSRRWRRSTVGHRARRTNTSGSSATAPCAIAPRSASGLATAR